MPALRLRPVARKLLQAFCRARVGRRLMMAVMKDEFLLDRVMLDVSNRKVRDMTFGAALTAAPPEIHGFEDLVWLYSSNRMNLGLSKLRLDEAAYLFRLVKSLPSPRVAEIGRYKGGTTVLLASAGAQLLSIDNDEDERRDERIAQHPQLAAAGLQPVPLKVSAASALRQLGLESRVKLVTANSTTYPVEPESFDVVFLDANRLFEGAMADFANWWPGVARGGVLIYRDGREPVSPGVMRACAELSRRTDLTVLENTPGALIGFRKTG